MLLYFVYIFVIIGKLNDKSQNTLFYRIIMHNLIENFKVDYLYLYLRL